MQIPESAKPFRLEDVEVGHLLVGRIRPEEKNFFAIRAEPHPAIPSEGPCLVLLNSWIADQALPLWFTGQRRQSVLDLGKHWFIDVPISEDEPTFRSAGNTLLFKVGADFFLKLEDGNYLNLSLGTLQSEPPHLNEAFVAWAAFSIRLREPDGDDKGAEIFRWPAPT
ncbi:hypothetical protein AAFN88_17820 [Pelagibius sp. CAU 1746]|uniref:hypothetical protein n=1 Tax=Pelagibius sp. CAU 1746 TaxID=3140370 RepID=UPI00325AF22A